MKKFELLTYQEQLFLMKYLPELVAGTINLRQPLSIGTMEETLIFYKDSLWDLLMQHYASDEQVLQLTLTPPHPLHTIFATPRIGFLTEPSAPPMEDSDYIAIYLSDKITFARTIPTILSRIDANKLTYFTRLVLQRSDLSLNHENILSLIEVFPTPLLEQHKRVFDQLLMLYIIDYCKIKQKNTREKIKSLYHHIIEALLKKGANILSQHNLMFPHAKHALPNVYVLQENQHALAHLIQSGNLDLELIAILINHSTNFFSTKINAEGTMTAILIKQKNWAAVKTIVETKIITIEEEQHEIELALLQAAIHGENNIVKTILDRYPGMVDVKTNDGNSLLHIAIQNNNLALTKIIAFHNPNLYIKNKLHKTAFDSAIKRNLWEHIIVVRKYAQDPDMKFYNYALAILIKNNHPYYLHYASFLLSFGASPNVRFHDGTTLLEKALHYDGDNIDLIKALIKNGFEWDIALIKRLLKEEHNIKTILNRCFSEKKTVKEMEGIASLLNVLMDDTSPLHNCSLEHMNGFVITWVKKQLQKSSENDFPFILFLLEKKPALLMKMLEHVLKSSSLTGNTAYQTLKQTFKNLFLKEHNPQKSLLIYLLKKHPDIFLLFLRCLDYSPLVENQIRNLLYDANSHEETLISNMDETVKSSLLKKFPSLEDTFKTLQLIQSQRHTLFFHSVTASKSDCPQPSAPSLESAEQKTHTSADTLTLLFEQAEQRITAMQRTEEAQQQEVTWESHFDFTLGPLITNTESKHQHRFFASSTQPSLAELAADMLNAAFNPADNDQPSTLTPAQFPTVLAGDEVDTVAFEAQFPRLPQQAINPNQHSTSRLML